MRVLFVSAQFPNDFVTSVYGVFQRMRMWFDAIRLGAPNIDVLFFVPPGTDTGVAAREALSRALYDYWGVSAEAFLCSQEESTSRNTLFDAYVRPALGMRAHPDYSMVSGVRQTEALADCLARSPELVFFHRLAATVPAMRLSLNGIDSFLDLDDIEHRKFIREVGQPPHWRFKPALYLQVPAIWLGERRATIQMKRVFVCSEPDREYLSSTMHLNNVAVIPNAVSKVHGSPLTSQPNVMFIGSYTYAPNVVAADYLISEVWPKLRARIPTATLLIAGSRPEVIKAFKIPPAGVCFLGFVADLEALYKRVRVLCCPIQSGGGTRIKILEAASFGVPVVSTSIGAEGLTLINGEEIVLRDDASAIAMGCAELIADDELADRIRKRARVRVEAEYSREAIVEKMAKMLFHK